LSASGAIVTALASALVPGISAVAGPLGYLFNQYALQRGRSLAPVQSIITAADPVISIAGRGGGR
jgi:hypothetical protein